MYSPYQVYIYLDVVCILSYILFPMLVKSAILYLLLKLLYLRGDTANK